MFTTSSLALFYIKSAHNRLGIEQKPNYLNMMKATGPKFVTCLFGPSNEIINIKPYHSNSVTSKEVKNDDGEEALPPSTPTQKMDKPEIETDSKNESKEDVKVKLFSGDDTDVASISTSNGSEKTPALHLDESADGDENANTTISTSASTPPQTPARHEQPSRPIKPQSYKKNIEKKTVPDTNTNATKASTNTKNKSTHTINLQELRRLSSQGVPDDCTFRSIAWRVLLGYLPLDTSKWESVLNRDRVLYQNLVNELFVASEHHPFEEEGYKLRGRGLKQDGRTLRVSPHSSPMKDAPSRISEAVEALSKTNLLDKVEQEAGEVEAENEAEEKELEIPFDVTEQWRKSGRDPESLTAAMGGKRSKASLLSRHFNALLVTNNDTASTTEEENSESAFDGDLDPKWKHFLDNASLLDEIRKDVVRTHPDLQFFLEERDHLGLRRYAAIERILFVWAKLNKGVSRYCIDSIILQQVMFDCCSLFSICTIFQRSATCKE